MIEQLILNYLATHPAIKARPLEDEAGVAANSIAKAKGGFQALSEETSWKLLYTLVGYGLQIADFDTFQNEGKIELRKIHLPPEMEGWKMDETGGFEIPPEILEKDPDFHPQFEVEWHVCTCWAELETFLRDE